MTQGIKFKSIAHTNPRDRMFCVTQGFFNITLIPAWERLLVDAGTSTPTDVSPIDFNKPNKREHHNFEYATKYYIDIEPGDCLYIPAYWWQQIEGSSDTQAIAVSYWY